MHCLIILETEPKLVTPYKIDKVVSSEIVDPIQNKEVFACVERHMIHKPWGVLNFKSPCMASDKNTSASLVCSKHFHKDYFEQTTCANNKYIIYSRR